MTVAGLLGRILMSCGVLIASATTGRYD